jgi:hypothetical protein
LDLRYLVSLFAAVAARLIEMIENPAISQACATATFAHIKWLTYF